MFLTLLTLFDVMHIPWIG